MNLFSQGFCKDLGLLIIRVGIGLLFIKHGYPKLVAGPQEWIWLGNQMSNFGIMFYPIVWGFIAASIEFFGGILLTIGLATPFAAFFMGCGMFVATTMHYMQGDSFGVYSQPLALLIVFIGLMVAGSGKYSLDAIFS